MAYKTSRRLDLSETVQNVTFANAHLPINRNLGLIIKIGPLTGNLTLATPTNMVAGDVIKFYFEQDVIGGRTVTFPGALSFGAGTANQKFMVAFDYDGTDFTEVIVDGGLTGFGIPTTSQAVWPSQIVPYAQAGLPINLALGQIPLITPN